MSKEATIDRPLAVVILAAGQGKRMRDPTKAKVLYPLAGTPLLGHVLNLTRKLHPERTVVIAGYALEQVESYLQADYPEVEIAIQSEQLGTGHAVNQAEPLLRGFDGDILVLSGDVPLLTHATVARLLDAHRKTGAQAAVLSVMLDDPSGYGRIVRGADGGGLIRIIEQRDADATTLAINEINSGIYVFRSDALFETLPAVGRGNAQGEYYLTDVFELLLQRFGNGSVQVTVTMDPIEASGINTRAQLLELEAQYYTRQTTIPS